VFLRENLDDSIKHADEVDGLFGLPLLGLIPLLKRKQFTGRSPAMLAQDDPRGAFAEAYRSMRTALQFSTTEGAPKRVMITSCSKAEGKSTTALALAINFAQLGRKVLLIDSDMRNPSIHKVLEVPNEVGLSNYLTGDLSGGKLIQSTKVPNLSVMTAGPPPPNPVDLLMGPKLMRLLDRAESMGYAQVVIDGPPILGLADAIVLGNQIQFILFAVKAGETRRSSIKDALRRLKIAGLLPIGVVMTHVSQHNAHDYAYEAYYGYGDRNVPVNAPSQAFHERDLQDDDDLRRPMTDSPQAKEEARRA
jgi:polysaccharide biosynthesis transport protein